MKKKKKTTQAFEGSTYLKEPRNREVLTGELVLAENHAVGAMANEPPKTIHISVREGIHG